MIDENEYYKIKKKLDEEIYDKLQKTIDERYTINKKNMINQKEYYEFKGDKTKNVFRILFFSVCFLLLILSLIIQFFK